MKNCLCPSCNKVAILWLAKLCLGPLRTIKCPNCSVKLSVPYYSLLTVMPFILCIALSPNMHTQTILSFAFLGFVIMSFLHVKFIPLIKRKL